MKKLIYLLVLSAFLSGCISYSKNFKQGLALYNYIILPTFASGVVMVKVSNYEKQLRAKQPDAEFKNIKVCLNKSRFDELDLNYASNNSEKENTKSVTSSEENTILSVKSTSLKELNFSNDKGGYEGNVEIDIKDGKGSKRYTYFVSTFDGRNTDPIAKANFDIFYAGRKQRQETIYFDKKNGNLIRVEEFGQNKQESDVTKCIN